MSAFSWRSLFAKSQGAKTEQKPETKQSRTQAPGELSKPAHRTPLGLARDAAYTVVKVIGDGVLDVISGPSDPAIKRRMDIAEQRRKELAELRDARQKQQALFRSRTPQNSRQR
ncbi:MAG: hypothetical protein ACRCS9_07020 [Hyphomicrobium sp.]